MSRMTLLVPAAVMAVAFATREAHGMEAEPLAGADLAAMRWNARPVVVLAEPGDPRLAAQVALLERDSAALAERQMVLLVGSPAEAGGIAGAGVSGDFAVLLIGKDGAVKARHAGVVDPAELIALVDTMPMRRREAGD